MDVPNSIEDSGWNLDEKTSLTHRGIRDYERIVKFEHELSETELAEVLIWLQTNNCPGWTPVFRARPYTTNMYRFRTTFDSSD